MLAKAPAARFPTAAALASALDDPASVAILAPARASGRMPRARLATLLAGTAALVALVVWWLTHVTVG
jgi:ferric-dicitrate binding protein FerR (iron transport regulator)